MRCCCHSKMTTTMHLNIVQLPARPCQPRCMQHGGRQHTHHAQHAAPHRNLISHAVKTSQTAPTAANKGSCYGCGADLQTETPGVAGYVQPDKYAVKKRHRQLNQVLCERCVALTHGEMIPGVEDWAQRVAMQQQASTSSHAAAQSDSEPQSAGAQRPRGLLSPDELREQLKGVRNEKAMIVMLIDLLDASGSFMNRIRDLVGANPIILVGTKLDLLPKGTNMEDVHEWLLDFARFKKLNIVDAYAVSSRSKEGLSEAIGSILRQRQGRNVYVLGAANVGKSAFVRALLAEMSSCSSTHYDPAAAANARYLPVESAMPGTTLGVLQLKAFASGGALFDTPGLHLHHRLPHLLTPDELKAAHPRGRLRPYLAPRPIDVCDEHGYADDAGVCCATYYLGGIARIDVVSCPPSTQLVSYAPPSMQMHALPLMDEFEDLEQDDDDDEAEFNDDEAEEDADDDDEDSDDVALFGQASVHRRGGLQIMKQMSITASGHRGALADIAVSGLCGWFTLYAPKSQGKIQLRVWAPKGVEVYIRPPLPVPNPLAMG